MGYCGDESPLAAARSNKKKIITKFRNCMRKHIRAINGKGEEKKHIVKEYTAD